MISPQLTLALAQTRIDDLRRAADAHRGARDRTQPARSVVTDGVVTLRFASTSDNNSLARLAALDSAEPPEQPVLLAEVHGELLAALALSDGTVISDPFQRTTDLIDLLHTRARQLDGPSKVRRCGRLRSWARLCPLTCGGRSTHRTPPADSHELHAACTGSAVWRRAVAIYAGAGKQRSSSRPPY
jgi:hypothetical protein